MKKQKLNNLNIKKIIATICLATTLSCANIKAEEESITKEEIIINDVLTVNEKEQPIYKINLGLGEELQELIYNKCQERNLDYLKVLGLIHHESKFEINSISSTNDYGLFQINKINHIALAKQLETKNEPLDPKINIEWGTYLLCNLYDYWKEKGISEEELDYYVWSSYNKGLTGFKKYGSAKEYIENINKSITYLSDIIKQEEISKIKRL